MIGSNTSKMSNSFAYLMPLVIAATLSVFAFLSAHSHHQAGENADIYAFPPSLGYLLVFCGLIFMSMPFWPGIPGEYSKATFFWVFSPFWGFSFFTAVWFFRYRIIVSKESMCIHSFRKRCVEFNEIIDTDFKIGPRSQEFVIYLKSAKKNMYQRTDPRL
jgi:hypothetical protein